jgi:DNA-binding SARP family transcriptional activator/tetratricopeptide (TPR) repeat protein
VEFRVLGPLQVWSPDGRVRIGGRQPAKVLAALLLDAGRLVTVDALIDAAWDGEAPATAKHQVHKVVADLRRRLPGAIETDGPGYRVHPAEFDADRFAALAAAGTTDDLTAALALWRGPALADVDSRVVRARAAVLDEHRFTAVERLADLRLAAGDAAAAVAGLTAAVRENPLRETLSVRLMVALDRSGRRADALTVFAHTRTVLADELGVDPGPELAETHRRLLLAENRPPAARHQESTPRPRASAITLPHDVPDFRGRAADLDRLRAAPGAVVITAIDGMAGVGKTALAVHAAHRLAGDYPDGQLFCDLHAHTPGGRPLEPETALELLLRMVGVRPDDIPDGLAARTARWRAELAGRRVLVVLDNAASARQVRPLLPGTSGCRAIVTSRRRLGVVDGATVLSLDVLPPTDALTLFATIVGRDRVHADPLAARRVVDRCGYLPLAIRVAGARLVHRPMWTVADLSRRLERERLGELSVDDRGVGPAFALSAACLDASLHRLFRLLGHHPGADFDVASAAALAGMPPSRAEPLLESLVDLHMLTQPAAGRYSFHDLLREYARTLVVGDEVALARDRLHDYYLAAATTATASIAAVDGDLDAALLWLDAERPALVALASSVPDWRLAQVLRVYFEHRGHFADWLLTHEHALRHADPAGAVLLRLGLGTRDMWMGRFVEGMDQFRAVLATADDPGVRAAALTSLGMLAHLAHRDAEAAGYLRRALTIDHDLSRVTALCLNNLGLTEGRFGRSSSALEYHERALAMARGAGSTAAERGILLGIGETSLRIGAPAETPFRLARDLARAGRFRMQEALALDGIAHATGDRAAWRAALTIFAELGAPQAALVRAHLDDPGTPHCDLCRSA